MSGPGNIILSFKSTAVLTGHAKLGKSYHFTKFHFPGLKEKGQLPLKVKEFHKF